MKFKDNVASGGGGKHFLKFKAGDKYSGVLRGDPHDFKTHWGDKNSTICVGEECIECRAGKKPTFRFRLNMVVNENGAYVAKIFEQGAKAYNYLKALSQDYDLEKTVVKIQRHGSTKDDTSYVVTPLPVQLTEKDLEKIAAVKLHDLANPASEPEVSDADDSTW